VRWRIGWLVLVSVLAAAWFVALLAGV